MSMEKYKIFISSVRRRWKLLAIKIREAKAMTFIYVAVDRYIKFYYHS